MKRGVGALLAVVVFLCAWWTLDRSDPTPTSSIPAARGTNAPSTVTPTERVERRDATTVAIAFAVSLETWDTVHDDSPLDASRRAAAYATPDLSRRLRREAPTPPQAWATVAARHATTSVTTIVGGLGPQPADGPTSAIRAITCVITDQAAGWLSDGGDAAVIAHLHRSRPGQPWAVRSFQLTII